MSRVLLEACAVGTPVIVHDRGLLGYLVRRYGLGRAVDCTDRNELRRALLAHVGEGEAEAYQACLAQFASRFSAARFQEAVFAPFVDPAQTLRSRGCLQGSMRR
jgi:hypothetical protein